VPFAERQIYINEVAKALCESGVNDILLSVDVFHQEFIPLKPVILFAEALLRHDTPAICVQPAWVVNEQHDNEYNSKTKRLIKLFTDKSIRSNEGNNIFPSGNALKHLSKYFSPPESVDLSVPCGSAPYTDKLDDVKCVSINAEGDVNVCTAIGNIYKSDILSIVEDYDPNGDPATKAVCTGGVPALLNYAKSQGLSVDISDCRSACGVCRKVMAIIKDKGAVEK
jgi:hypothetical protein